MSDSGVNRWTTAKGSSGNSRRLTVVEDMNKVTYPLLASTVTVELTDPDTGKADNRETMPPRTPIVLDITSVSSGAWGFRFVAQLANGE